MHRTHYRKLPLQEKDDCLTCGLLKSPPGGGKTLTMLAEMAAEPAVYLLAAPRIDLIAEHVARLRGMATVAGRSPVIVEVHSRTPGAKGKVDRRLRDEIAAILDPLARTVTPHVVIATTHAALMSLAPGEAEDLHVRVDELPDGAIVSGRIGLALTWHSMAALYDLVPGTEAGWFRLVPRPGTGKISLKQMLGGVGKELVELHRLAASRGRVVEVDVAAWADAGVPDAPPVRWRSIWSVVSLRGAASLMMTAAGYEHSLARQAIERIGGVRVVPVAVGGPRTGQPRIRVAYFAGRHVGSTAWWRTKVGRGCLVAASRHLEAIGFDGYWSANADIVPFFTGRVGGSEESPKLAGTNGLRAHTSCAMIYSAKATPADEAVIDALRLDPDAVRAAREDEDVLQFVCRGAIRDPAYGGDYDVFLYDLAQAERLRARLLDGGFTDVVLVPMVEAGIVDIERPKTRGAAKPTIPASVKTADQRRKATRQSDRDRKRAQRAIAKAAKIAAGTYRPRGRPRRSE